MSYLTLPNGIPNFSKAVISLWFRVPRESMLAVAQQPPPAGRLWRILPLMVFGEMFEGYTLKSESEGSSTYTITNGTYSGSTFSELGSDTFEYSTGAKLSRGEAADKNPSYIGMSCSLDEDSGEVTAFLRVRLQMWDLGSGEWAFATTHRSISDATAIVSASGVGYPTDTAYDGSIGECTTGAAAPDGAKTTTVTNRDETAIWAEQEGADALEAGIDLEIESDTWHHVLISFDLDHSPVAQGATIFDAYGCSPDPDRSENSIRAISDPYQIWIAFDDVNYADDYLGDPRISGFRPEGLDSNGIAPLNSILTTQQTSGGTSSKSWGTTGIVEVTDWQMAGMPTYHNAPGTIPSDGHEFGFPSTPALVDSIYRVEMAEFQMWTGVTLNTAIISNRRAFVDENGKPVKPTGTEDEPPPAEVLLGRRPDILLHGSSKWKEGYNTGSLGVEIITDGEVIELPDGQFIPTAAIEKYKPEPQLDETPSA